MDFAGGRVVPVGHDIARLLTDYAILHAPKEAIPTGHVLPPEAQSAFFEGYGLVGPGDPSVRLLLLAPLESVVVGVVGVVILALILDLILLGIGRLTTPRGIRV